MMDNQTIRKIDSENILVITTREEKNVIGKKSLQDQIEGKETELQKLRDLLKEYE